MRWRLGATGYYNRGWRGPFFPPGLPQSKWLSHYATRFDAIELNTTFHAAPTPQRVRDWAAKVPDDFRFSLKAPRAVTHDVALSNAADPLAAFLETVVELGPKLGVVLLQFGPHHGVNELPALERLLAGLPKRFGDGGRFAVEFRDASWLAPPTYRALRAHGAALVAADLEDLPAAAGIVPTADFLYVRLLGKHGRFESDDHELFDPTPRLTWWRDRLRRAIASGRFGPDGPAEAWVLSNNDFAGHAPATLRRIAGLLDAPLPGDEVKAQADLFD
ncbi:DUF72 domain-containing protein [Alienimonas californiensis]|uniref:DUF72 domain-containing protein n=1 Tax=Alienimonas californiensis TaxID=2527989 RepID=A0A517P9U1_9PLAN|nr:DUF72 domain-containing protein [Alienimonas californiensis]QDT16141.1 hypothetical protein CA12_22390 [Alienimonas californiensis]